MRIAFIEVAGFRGFRNQARFEFPPGYAVLTGRNGAGKSSVLDAVDFILTGTINRYAVTSAKGGGLDQHIWWIGSTPAEQQYVLLGLADDNGGITTIKRSRLKGLEASESQIVDALCVSHSTRTGFLATLARTSLIRDETIAALSVDLTGQSRFDELKASLGDVTLPGLAARIDSLKRASISARDSQATKTISVKEELARTLALLAEARGLASRHADISEAEGIIERLAPQALTAGRGRSELLRREVAARRQRLSQARQLVARFRDLRERERAFRLRQTSDAGSSLEDQVEVQRKRFKAAQKNLEGVQQREEAERQNDSLAGHLAELIRHGRIVGLQSGHCPLCDAERTNEEFAGALARSEGALIARGSRLPEAANAVRVALRECEEAKRLLGETEARIAAVHAEALRFSSEAATLEAEAQRTQVDIATIDQAGMSAEVVAQSEDAASLERALLILESSMAHDRVVELEGAVERLRAIVEAEASELAMRGQVADAADRVGKAVQEVSNQALEEQFDTVLPVLQELYQRLRPHTEWRDIAIDFGGRIRASLNFSVGDGRNPQFLFSSGQRRAAGLAFLLALHLSRPWCRLRSLLLDDPVQHIDDYRSLNLVEVLAAIRRSGRQIIVAVEDVALADLLCRRLGSSADDRGRRFELAAGPDGSSAIIDVKDVPPLPAEALLRASA